MDEILNKILSLLKERNIPKGKFLKDLDFNKSAIAGWISGEHASYKKKLPEIANYFGVSLDWLSGNEQKEKPLTDRERLIQECLSIMNSLPEDLQRAAREQLKALAAVADKNKKK